MCARWGLDIARSLSDAGGVGALLEIADISSGKTFFPCYDGNGNVVALLNASTGAAAAVYEYSPYGEALRAETLDPVVADQPFRFSTKFFDVETGLYAYIRRYYDPRTGRWLGRDPMEEKGGLHLYGFCGNNPINKWDYLGMTVTGEAGYGGDIEGGGDFNPFTMAVNTDGIRTGTMTTSEASTLEAQYRAAGVSVTSGPNLPQAVADIARYAFAGANGAAISGNGQLGLYLVQYSAQSKSWTIMPTDSVTTNYGFVNGITGDLASHAGLGIDHLQSLFGQNNVTSFTLFNIPTQGFWGDVLDASLEKLGVNTDASKLLTATLQNTQEVNNETGGAVVQWVAHSGGGAAFAQAMNYSLSNGSTNLSYNAVTFDGGANNMSVTNSIAQNVHVTVNGYNYSPLDAVPNVIGANGNVLSIPLSIIAAPTLFYGPPLSQHTRPTGTWHHYPGTGGGGG